jgi:predicted metal-dependent phosphotriesterase family hydrolase
MSLVRTVTGDITPESLGITYSHEHLIASPPEWKAKQDPDLVIRDFDKAIEEVQMFKALGGQSLYEASAYDYGRDVRALHKIAQQTGIQIIATAGFNKGLWFDAMIADWSREELERHIVREVKEGIDGTTIRGGIVKFGSGYNHISELEELVIRAAAYAHRTTGAPLHGHTESGTMGLEQLEILREEGVDLSHVGITHVSRNLDPWYLRKMAQTGAFLCFDGLSKVKYGPESQRIEAIIRLCQLGYTDQILIGGDLARKGDLYAYTRGPGLKYILGTWIPRFREEMSEQGFLPEKIEQTIHAFLVDNPRRYFSFAQPY